MTTEIQVQSCVLLLTQAEVIPILEAAAGAKLVSIKGLKGSPFWSKTTTTAAPKPERFVFEYLVLVFDKGDIKIDEFAAKIKATTTIDLKNSIINISVPWAETEKANKAARTAKEAKAKEAKAKEAKAKEAKAAKAAAIANAAAIAKPAKVSRPAPARPAPARPAPAPRVPVIPKRLIVSSGKVGEDNIVPLPQGVSGTA